MKRGFFSWLCALLILGLSQAAFAEDPPNYGFVPNIGDASVSKVDLKANVTVARYSTAPRFNQNITSPTMAGIFGVALGPFPVQPADWRTSRIAIDSEGNAWVLNTGADCFLNGVEKAYLNGLPIQGTVVRIQGDTTGLANTSTSHDDMRTFGTDDAVEAYKVGGTNDIPRTVNFDANGNLWIGFHMALKKWGYFQKYTYDKCLKTLTSVGSPVATTTWDIAPYNGAIDKNGVLWFTSYGSIRVGRYTGQSWPADHGVYSFNTAAPVVTRYEGITHSSGTTAYGILVDNTPTNPHVKVYATSLEGGAQMWVWDSTMGGNFMPIPIAGGPNPDPNGPGLRSLAFDKYGRIWIAGSMSGRVHWYNPSTYSSGYSSVVGTTPVGVGMDDTGDMWVVVRDSDRLVTFTPPAAPSEPVNDFGGFITVAVGPQPYAYGDFTRVPTYYKICGYKYKAGTSPKLGLADWTINLYKKEGGSFPASPTATTVTDANGHYCFTNLVAGVYKVTETLLSGWHQVYPGTNEHIVTLPDSDPCNPVDKSYDFENTPPVCFDETAWAANAGPLTLRFVPKGNWATYIKYTFGSGSAGDPKHYSLFAGQTYFVGYLLVYDEGNYLYLKYEVDPAGDPKQTYKPGYCPTSGWEMTEYHFQVVDEFSGFDPFRTSTGNPIPGQFMNNGSPMADGWFRVSIKKFGGGDAYIAAHAVMKWCGYRCSF